MNLANQLREIADDLESAAGELRQLREEARRDHATIDNLRQALKQLRAGEDLNTVAGLQKEVARLNKLLDAFHAGNVSPRLLSADTERRIREAFEAGRSGEGGGHP